MDKILVIQDSPSIKEVLKFRLESEGFSVDAVDTGEEGLAKVKENQYQLILLDYELPGISGIELGRLLKENEAAMKVPVILMSAMDRDELPDCASQARADDYINSPYGKEELIKKIKKLINKEKQRGRK